jgi:putative PIN family toxin of toxin-antitoxin system
VLKNSKITADTNVLISSLICVSAVAVKVIDLAEEGLCEIAVSEDIIKEFNRVAVIKFGWNKEKTSLAEGVLRRLCKVVSPAIKVKAVKQDPDDDKIIECAIEAGSHYIVTGDKHLLDLGGYKTIKILTLADFIKLMI